MAGLRPGHPRLAVHMQPGMTSCQSFAASDCVA